ncbi:MAG: hypothetical protein GY816_00845 [Cytophagales bacterium]|nr:hypothetical protein [Cytophagales bacterium]
MWIFDTPKKLYHKHEQEKKSKYEERILEVEKGSFCPLVYSTTGGVGHLCETHHKRVARLIADKRKEDYPYIIRYIRTKLRFVLLRSVLMSLRGTRGKAYTECVKLSDVSFGLIPEMSCYEI